MPDNAQRAINRFSGPFVEFASSLAADIVARFAFGHGMAPADKQYVSGVQKLFGEGKKKEALEMLEALPGGFGLADEMIMLTDLLALIRGGLLDPDPDLNQIMADDLSNFLMGLTNIQREKFRLTQVKESDKDIRRANLVVLARLRTDTERHAWLENAGIFNEDMTDHINQLNVHAGIARTQLQLDAQADLDAVTARRANPRQGWLGRLLNLNPLR